MTKIIKNARLILKNSDQISDTPSIPSNDDHTSGQWTKTDIYISELYLNSIDDKLWIRTYNGIKSVMTNDGYGGTNSIALFKNENVLTKSIITQDTSSRISVSGDMNITGQYYVNGISLFGGSTSAITYTAPFTAGFIPVITTGKTLTNSQLAYNSSGLTVYDYINTTDGYRLNGNPLSINDLNDLYTFNNGLSIDIDNNVSFGGTLLSNAYLDSNSTESLYIGLYNPLNNITLISNNNLLLENGNANISLNTGITLSNQNTSVILSQNGMSYNMSLSGYNMYNDLWIPDKQYVDSIVNNVTADLVGYVNVGYPTLTNVKLALDQILYVNPTASLTINATGDSLTGTLAEKGSNITSLILHWVVNKTMVSINLSGPGGFTATGNTALLNENINVTSLPTTTAAYTISAIDSKPATANGSATLTFTQKVYYGISPLTSFTTSSDIMSLSTSLLSTTRARSFTIANGAGEYIYYCYPTAYGTATFTIGGFGVSMIVSTVSYTNDFGVSENYYVCRNAVISNGSNINVVIT